jgi:hypothetical protein
MRRLIEVLAMTVAELIERLKSWPDQTARVACEYTDNCDENCLAEITVLAPREAIIDESGYIDVRRHGRTDNQLMTSVVVLA